MDPKMLSGVCLPEADGERLVPVVRYFSRGGDQRLAVRQQRQIPDGPGLNEVIGTQSGPGARWERIVIFSFAETMHALDSCRIPGRGSTPVCNAARSRTVSGWSQLSGISPAVVTSVLPSGSNARFRMAPG